MMHSQTHLRTRPIGAGNLRAFEAVARHLNFRAAAEEMALTQSAVSRQIQALEEEVGTSLFNRHTRSVELTAAGMGLLGSVAPSLERIDSSVRQIRTSVGRKHVALTTFASFASMWLIPRLEEFQKTEPGIDFRIDASDVSVDMETADVDVALRYGPARSMPAHAIRLFGEQLTPAASPWLLKSEAKIKSPLDFANFRVTTANPGICDCGFGGGNQDCGRNGQFRSGGGFVARFGDCRSYFGVLWVGRLQMGLGTAVVSAVDGAVARRRV